MSALRLLMPLYRSRWRRVLIVLALAGTTAAAGLALLGVSGWFLSGAALAGSMLAFNLFVPSALIRLFSFIRIGSRYAEKVIGHATTLRLLADLRTQTFASLMRKPASELGALRQGDTVSLLVADIDALDAILLSVVVPLCVALTAGAVLAAVWWPNSPAAAFAFGIAAVVATACAPVVLARWAYVWGRRGHAATRLARHEVLDTVAGLGDLTALGAGDVARRRFERALQQGSDARLTQARLAAGGQTVLQIVAGWCVLGVSFLGIDAWQSGRLSGPLLAGLVLATLGFFELAVPAMRNAARLGAAQAASERITAMLGEPGPTGGGEASGLADPGYASHRSLSNDVSLASCSARPAAIPLGPISLRGVCAGYNDSQTIIRDLSLDVEVGERLAIVGASGSGKSTVLNLMMQLLAPRSGCIEVGGVDLRDVPVQQWHRHVALLTQDAPVFLGTVRTNLLIGRHDATEDQLWRALDQALLGDHVRSLPEGLDTWTGETGWSLSAGQARRLCLARVMLSQASVWLLDEPTAGLDTENERLFLSALAASASHRTVVVATHAHLPELSVDRVFVMPAGGGYSLR